MNEYMYVREGGRDDGQVDKQMSRRKEGRKGWVDRSMGGLRDK